MVKKLLEKAPELKRFRIRGGQQSMHHWSHAVLALSALLLLSCYLQVIPDPDRFFEYAKGILPLTMALFIFYRIWREQNIYLLRYGLQDGKTVALFFSSLLATVLAIFPLQFLLNRLFAHYYKLAGMWIEGSDRLLATGPFTGLIPTYTMAWMVFTASLGLLAFSLIFFLLYDHAANKADKLQLSEIEIILTRFSSHSWLTTVAAAALATSFSLISLITGYAFFLFLAGMTYPVLWLTTPLLAREAQHKVRRVVEAEEV